MEGDLNSRNRWDENKVVCIIGSTGTGKSKLGIELALKLKTQSKIDCEIINADAMQIYQGLDIMTNKVTNEETQGVNHHLLNILDPITNQIQKIGEECVQLQEHFNSNTFTQMAIPLIDNMHRNKILPIIVGGTHYYIESLLYHNHSLEDELSSEVSTVETTENSDLYEQLTRLDPVMAQKLHPHETRKIKRSLEVIQKTGMMHSEILKRKQEHEQLRYNAIFLWVDCDSSILAERLDKRVDVMVSRGLIEELRALREQNLHHGNAEDYTKGIFQSIGCREFEEYFSLADDVPNREDVLNNCFDSLKRHTRRYAKTQKSWIKRLLSRSALIYRLDSSDLFRWTENVLLSAMNIVDPFLSNRTVPSDNLVTSNDKKATKNLDTWKKYTCDDCNGRVLNGLHEWEAHLKSNGHKASKRRKRKKLAHQFNANNHNNNNDNEKSPNKEHT